MNLVQVFKMAWKSIWGKKGRSALTILGIFIGIAAVMTIVSVMEGVKEKSMEQFEAMGTNRINVYMWSYQYDEEGNSIEKDYFSALYDYCLSLGEYVDGITPSQTFWGTVSYGTLSSDTMGYEYDEQWNLISAPPSLYLGSDQYSVCNNLTIGRGRDIAYLDSRNYSQVCVMGAKAAEIFFDAADPVGQVLKVDGNEFEVVGVYAPRVSTQSSNAQIDNFILFPYTASRLLGTGTSNEFLIKAKDADAMSYVISYLGGFLKGLIPEYSGSYSVYSESSWQEQSNEYMTMIGLVLGGIAAISLLVGGIGIMNIMLVTVTERTREIGIRRAIGAQRGSIVLQFLVEAAMLCGIGGIIGIAVGTVGSIVLSKLIVQMTIYPSVGVTLVAFGFSIVLGIVFGIYPAIKASKLQPVEALRAE